MLLKPLVFASLIALITALAATAEARTQRHSCADTDPSCFSDPQSKSVAYNKRGMKFDDNGDYVNAISDYTAAIEGDPNNDDAVFNRGLAYYHQGFQELDRRKVQAVRDGQKVDETPPSQFKFAIDDYTKFIGMATTDEMKWIRRAYLHRGELFLKTRAYDRCIADETKAIELETPDLKTAYSTRGLCYKAINDITRATADFELVVKVNKDEGNRLLSLLWNEQRQRAQAATPATPALAPQIP